MNALRKKDNHFFELYEYAYDKDGNEYRWDELILCPLEGEQVNYRISQEKEEELRERYAGMALQGIIGNPLLLEANIKQAKDKQEDEVEVICKGAVEWADELIKQLKK